MLSWNTSAVDRSDEWSTVAKPDPAAELNDEEDFEEDVELDLDEDEEEEEEEEDDDEEWEAFEEALDGDEPHHRHRPLSDWD